MRYEVSVMNAGFVARFWGQDIEKVLGRRLNGWDVDILSRLMEMIRTKADGK